MKLGLGFLIKCGVEKTKIKEDVAVVKAKSGHYLP